MGNKETNKFRKIKITFDKEGDFFVALIKIDKKVERVTQSKNLKGLFKNMQEVINLVLGEN
jgi:hypothetical protein